MFDLTSVVLLAAVAVIASLFWQLRRLGERAQAYAIHYCKQNQLQFLDIARQSNRLRWSKRGPIWQSEFNFGFSSDKEHRYEGILIFVNTRLASVKMPVYRVPEDANNETSNSPSYH